MRRFTLSTSRDPHTTEPPAGQQRHERTPANRVSEDDVVRVTGTVRELMIAEFEDEFGAFDEGFDEEAFGGEPVVVANRVIVLSNETAD